MKASFIALVMFAVPVLTRAGVDTGSLHPIWPIIESESETFRKSGNSAEQLLQARTIVDGSSWAALGATPTNRVLESVGRLSAAILILGDVGGPADEERLVRFADLRIQSPALKYGAPILPDVPHLSLGSITGLSERQQFPACYALSEILRRAPASATDFLLSTAGDNNVSLEIRLRVFAVLIDAKSPIANDYKQRLTRQSSLPQLSKTIKEIEAGDKRYWSQSM
jgi:hypothetical protein